MRRVGPRARSNDKVEPIAIGVFAKLGALHFTSVNFDIGNETPGILPLLTQQAIQQATEREI
jgi:hypothetical protein